MQWLIVFLGNLAVSLVSYMMQKGLRRAAMVLTGISIVVGLFVAFVAGAYAVLNGLLTLAPDGVAFGLSMLPSSTPFYISSYLTLLVAKRLFDWSSMFSTEFYRALSNG